MVCPECSACVHLTPAMPAVIIASNNNKTRSNNIKEFKPNL